MFGPIPKSPLPRRKQSRPPDIEERVKPVPKKEFKPMQRAEGPADYIPAPSPNPKGPFMSAKRRARLGEYPAIFLTGMRDAMSWGGPGADIPIPGGPAYPIPGGIGTMDAAGNRLGYETEGTEDPAALARAAGGVVGGVVNPIGLGFQAAMGLPGTVARYVNEAKPGLAEAGKRLMGRARDLAKYGPNAIRAGYRSRFGRAGAQFAPGGDRIGPGATTFDDYARQAVVPADTPGPETLPNVGAGAPPPPPASQAAAEADWWSRNVKPPRPGAIRSPEAVQRAEGLSEVYRTKAVPARLAPGESPHPSKWRSERLPFATGRRVVKMDPAQLTEELAQKPDLLTREAVYRRLRELTSPRLEATDQARVRGFRRAANREAAATKAAREAKLMREAEAAADFETPLYEPPKRNPKPHDWREFERWRKEGRP
jgi:hypothetical protein